MTKLYHNMVNHVANVNEEAAHYLIHEAPKLPNFMDAEEDDIPLGTKLSRVFAWASTPMGPGMWVDLSNYLYELEEGE